MRVFADRDPVWLWSRMQLNKHTFVIDYLRHLYATKPYKAIKKLQGNFHSDEGDFTAAKSWIAINIWLKHTTRRACEGAAFACSQHCAVLDISIKSLIIESA